MTDNSEILKRAEDLIGDKLWCTAPFEELAFLDNGDVFPCCPDYIDRYAYGNIYQNLSAEISSGERATAFRQAVVDASFRFCHLDMCLNFHNLKYNIKHNSRKTFENIDIKNVKIKRIQLNIDSSCNVRCVTCRDIFVQDSDEEFARKKKVFHEVILPFFRENAIEEVYMNGSGEIFASKISLYMLKILSEEFPSIRYSIITNGMLFDEKRCLELGIIDKIRKVIFSIHATTKETYEKIVRGGDFERVMRNLKFAVDMKNQGKIDEIDMNFVVSTLNFEEMPDFQRLANEYNVFTHFTEYRPWGNVEMDKNYEKFAVYLPENPLYERFKEVLKDDIFKSINCNMNLRLAD